MNVYEDQLKILAKNIAVQVRDYATKGDPNGFYFYLTAIEDFGEMRDTDIWIVANPNSGLPIQDEFINVDIEQVNLPEETKGILKDAYLGQTKSYNDYDSIYEKTMFHLATPVSDRNGHVVGAILLHAAVDVQEGSIRQYQKYMVISIIVGLLISFLLAIFFSKQIAGPIAKMKQTAIIMAAGTYDISIDTTRKDEIGQLAGSLSILAKRLEEARKLQDDNEQSRRDFFSNVSHELRTPITVMKGYTETLADGYVKDPAKQKEYYDRILKECTGMERLVSDLLILSKMQNPDFALDFEELNVIAVAQDVVRGMRIQLKEKNIEADIVYDDECSLIEGDYDRIRQLFLIILQNAVKYSDQGTKIEIRISKLSQAIKVYIKDQGKGIAVEDKERVFEKFYRGSDQKEKDGSGLGLVVAKHIMERHGGTIEVESRIGEGSTFIMRFETVKNKLKK